MFLSSDHSLILILLNVDELHGLHGSYVAEQLSNGLLVLAQFIFDIAQMQSLAGRVEGDTFAVVETMHARLGDKDLSLSGLKGKRKLDLLVIRVKDLQLHSKKELVIQVIERVLRVQQLFELYQS